MPTPETRRFLLDARDEASGYLGRELTDSEWAEAYPPAAQKLSRIIQLYGDHGGDRRQPWYLGKLVQEHIAFSVLSAYCALSAQKKDRLRRGRPSHHHKYNTQHHPMSILKGDAA